MEAKFKKRLLKLADLLEANAKNRKGAKFDLSVVGTVDTMNSPAMNCGTVGCAIGLAAVSGAFRGLKAVNDGFGTIDIFYDGDDLLYDEVAEQVFGVPIGDVPALFTVGPQWGNKVTVGAQGERNVAGAIRHYVKTGETPNFGR